MPDIFNAASTVDSSVSNTSTPQTDESQSAVQSNVQTSPSRNATSSNSNPSGYLNRFEQVHSATNPLGAFLFQPAGTFFDSKEYQEKVLLLLRQHPVTQLKWLVIGGVLAVIPLLFFLIPFLAFLPSNYQFMLILGWYQMVLGVLFAAFLNWFFDVWIVTSDRVIDVDFISLLFKHVSYTQIDRIEDVTATTAGTLGSIFNFGNVRVQTAGATDQFKFRRVPQPTEVAEFINRMLVEKEREERGGNQSNAEPNS